MPCIGLTDLQLDNKTRAEQQASESSDAEVETVVQPVKAE